MQVVWQDLVLVFILILVTFKSIIDLYIYTLQARNISLVSRNYDALNKIIEEVHKIVERNS